ncbi:MAG: hypothetical protein ACOC0U_01085 [Desulfovibrionales bacterium]
MSICTTCGREMRFAETCTCDEIMIGSVWFRRIPYGREVSGWAVDFERCPRCNVEEGGMHHPGCELDECPRCRNQYISCACTDEEDEVSRAARDLWKHVIDAQ